MSSRNGIRKAPFCVQLCALLGLSSPAINGIFAHWVVNNRHVTHSCVEGGEAKKNQHVFFRSVVCEYWKNCTVRNSFAASKCGEGKLGGSKNVSFLQLRCNLWHPGNSVASFSNLFAPKYQYTWDGSGTAIWQEKCTSQTFTIKKHLLDRSQSQADHHEVETYQKAKLLSNKV